MDRCPHRRARCKGGGVTWPNENPLTPDSLAADGIQGAGAKASGPSDANATGTRRGGQTAGVQGVTRARVAVQGAAALLGAYARQTDFPPAGIVEAADLLDVALSALDGAP